MVVDTLRDEARGKGVLYNLEFFFMFMKRGMRGMVSLFLLVPLLHDSHSPKHFFPIVVGDQSV